MLSFDLNATLLVVFVFVDVLGIIEAVAAVAPEAACKGLELFEEEDTVFFVLFSFDGI